MFKLPSLWYFIIVALQPKTITLNKLLISLVSESSPVKRRKIIKYFS